MMQELGGEQRFECRHLNRPAVYTLALSSDEVQHTCAAWQGQGGCYTDECNTPEALRKTLNEAAARLPRDGCTVSLEIELWNAGPGTGKSYMIKQMYRQGRDVVVAPFRALNATYPAPHFRYFTTHRALSHIVGNFDVLYVDEFTCFDFRVVIAVAFNHGVSKIVLVGDPNRTSFVRNMAGMLMVTFYHERPRQTCHFWKCRAHYSRFVFGVPVVTS